MKDLYAVLGVSCDATLSEIKAAYRRMALQLHPDKLRTQPQHHHQSEASQRSSAGMDLLSISGRNAERMHSFQEVQDAYSTLSDDFKRLMYDSERTALMATESQFHLPPSGLRTASNRVTSATKSSYSFTPSPSFSRPSSVQMSRKGFVAAAVGTAGGFAETMRCVAEEQQFFDEANVKWDEVFHERHGAIERRPHSRQTHSRGGNGDHSRPPVSSVTRGSSANNANVTTFDGQHANSAPMGGEQPSQSAEEGTHKHLLPTTQHSGEQQPTQLDVSSRPNSRRQSGHRVSSHVAETLQRRLHPPNAANYLQPLTLLNLDHDEEEACVSATSGARRGGGGAEDSQVHLSSSKPPLPGSRATSALKDVGTGSSCELESQVPRFTPVRATSSSPLHSRRNFHATNDEEKFKSSCASPGLHRVTPGGGKQSALDNPNSVIGGMTAARRKLLGIGCGTPQSDRRFSQPSKSDTLQAVASRKTLQLFFA